jgi:hypothetical protein
MKKRLLIFLATLLMGMTSLPALAAEESEGHALVLMLGGAAEKIVSEATSNVGPTASVEFLVIEDLLEIELGTQYLSSSYPHTLGGQILFKKPFEVTHNIELMVGAGPAITHATSGASPINQYGISFALDLMVWTSKEMGWFISPEYNYGVGASSERSIGLSLGLMFGL